LRIDYRIADVAPYVNWIYYYHAWGVKQSDEQRRLRAEAEQWLERLDERYSTHALFSILDANGDGDDIIIGSTRLPMLRQQHLREGEPCLCLADFVMPRESGRTDKVGVFATTVDIGMETDYDGDAYEKMLVQLLADRLAEATAEKMHEEVRRSYWGYAPDERLSIEEQHQERFQGIRPAVGYPSLPDASINFLLSDILDMKQIGIRLTESGAMKPHASVSGLMIAHPSARYFDVGTVGDDQLRDYARRRGLPLQLMRRFLAPIAPRTKTG